MLQPEQVQNVQALAAQGLDYFEIAKRRALAKRKARARAMQPYPMRHVRANGVRVCIECHAPLEGIEHPRRKRIALRCSSCKQARTIALTRTSGQRAAMLAVKIAVKAGTLRPPTSRPCADCRNRADVYDHRDYSRQLDVRAVCYRCNFLRGHALPVGGLFTRLVGA